MTAKKTISRKQEHLDIVLNSNPGFQQKQTGFGDIELVYKTLPEMDLEEADPATSFLGKKFTAPLMVSGMTGGIQEARKINRDIAAACEEIGIGFGVGSQRAMIEQPALTDTYAVRDVAPNILLAGNIGAGQLKNYSPNQLQQMVDAIQADCLAIHVNAAQEAVQPEGNPHFRGVLDQIAEVVQALEVPVYVKEVGHGISRESAAVLSQTGVAALDVGGSGGTSWTGVEYLRAKDTSQAYWDFGIPTALSVLETKREFTRDIIATGGIRNGLDVVKMLVLGATLGGIASPVIKAQHKGGKQGVIKVLNQFIADIRIGMFLLGAKEVTELRNTPYVLLGRSREYALARDLL